MSDKIDTKVVQVSNIAPNATRDQMKTLFSYLGRIDDIKMFPKESSELQVTAKVCYVKYDDCTSVGVALHLTNTVFIDRALVVIPVMENDIPDEQSALQRAPTAVAGMLSGQPTWPSNVISQLQSIGGCTVIITNDPRLTALGLAQYPPLPSNTDPSKIEEIRRTVYVSNLDPTISGDQILTFFGQVGEILYVRMGGEEVEGGKCAYVEFTDQRSIATALTYNGVMFQGRSLSVAHSNSAIEKPKTKMQEAVQREIDEAMKKVKEAQSLITAAADSGDTNIDKTVSKLASSFGRSRSRSRSRSKRHRSRSRSRRSRSRSRHRRSHSRHRSRSKRRSRSRKRSRSGSRKKRSTSRSAEIVKAIVGKTELPVPVFGATGLKKPGPGMPGGPGTGRKRSRSASRKRGRTRSRSRRRKSRSRSRRRRSRSRRRSHSRGRRSRSRKRSRSRHRSRSRRRSRSRSTSRSRQEGYRGSGSAGKPSENSSNHRSAGKPSENSSNHRSSPVSKSKTSDRKRSSSRGRSRSPAKKSRRSRSRSRGRKGMKSRRRSRSTSPRRRRSRSRKRSRSRSGSRHRSRKDKKKESHRDRERERDRSRERDKKKKHKEKEREKEEKKESKENKVKRDYDEEEKILYDDDDKVAANRKSSSDDDDDDDDDNNKSKGSSPEPIPTRITSNIDTDLQQVDMEMSD